MCALATASAGKTSIGRRQVEDHDSWHRTACQRIGNPRRELFHVFRSDTEDGSGRRYRSWEGLGIAYCLLN
jgi:hypothetical protein